MYLTDRPAVDRSSRGRGRARGRVAGTVVLMGCVSLFTDVSSESVSAVLAIYLTTVVGLGPLAYGFVDGIYQGVSALVRILGGWAADRTDHPKWVAAIGYGLSAGTRAALIPAHGLGAITSIVAVDRIGKGIRTAPRDSVIAASSPPEALGRAFGVHRTLDTVGAVIGPFLAFAILFALPGDYRAVFVVSFAAALVGLAILLLLVPDVRPRRAARQRPTPPTAAPVEAPGARTALWRSAPFRRLAIGTALLGVLTIGDGFLYLALQQRDDLALEYFPLLYVGTNLAYLALALPLGRIADRVGRARVFVAGHVALLAAYLCSGGPVTGPAVTVGCLVLIGTYYAATDGQLAALASRLSGSTSRGVAIASVQTAQALARFVSSVMFGLLWSLTTQATAILTVAVALTAALPALWLLLRQTDRGGPALAAGPA